MVIIDKLIKGLTGGFFSIGNSIKVASGALVTENDKYFTDQGVTKQWYVKNMPWEYEDSFITKVTEEIGQIDPSLVVTFHLKPKKVNLSVRDDSFLRTMEKRIQRYEDHQEIWDKNVSSYRKKKGVFAVSPLGSFNMTEDKIEGMRYEADSFTDINLFIRKSKGTLWSTTLQIQVRFPTIDTMKAFEKMVDGVISDNTRIKDTVDKKIASQLAAHSPSVRNVNGSKQPDFLVTNKNLTHLLPYQKEGIICQTGTSLGINQSNLTHLYADPYSSPEGSSSLTCGKAGSGKTFTGMYQTLQLAGAGVTVLYIDIKGTEIYQSLSQLMDSITMVDFSEESASFLNTMFISKETAKEMEDDKNPSNRVQGYNMVQAMKATAEMLSIFVNLPPGDEREQDIENSLMNAVQSYYNDVGVVNENHDTYYKSQQMTYAGLMTYIAHQRNSATKDKERELYELIQKRVGENIQRYKLENNKNAIHLEQLYQYSVITFNFNKNNEIKLGLIDSVRVYMTLMITKRIASYNKRQGLFTELKVEEGQECVNNLPIARAVSSIAAVARAMNLSVNMLMNNMDALRIPELSGFRANVTNFIIGKVDGSAVALLRDVFKKEKLADDVELIISKPKKYERTFAVHFEVGQTQFNAMTKCEVPADIAEAFKTRTVKEV